MHSIPWLEMQKRMAEFGPVPRDCCDLFSFRADVKVHRQFVLQEIQTMNYETLEQMARGSFNVVADGVSHKVALLRREKMSSEEIEKIPRYGGIPIIEGASYEIASLSDYVWSKMRESLGSRRLVEQIRLYNLMTPGPQLGRYSGLLFDSIGQRELQFGPTTDIAVRSVELEPNQPKS
jgi:hypothetical protein